MKPYKTDKERKDSVLQFRLNVGERKRFEKLARETGLSFSNIFRLRVLGELQPLEELSAEIKRAVAEQEAIREREGEEKAREAQVRRIASKRTPRKLQKAG